MMTSERLREIARILTSAGGDFTSQWDRQAALELLQLADEFDRVMKPERDVNKYALTKKRK